MNFKEALQYLDSLVNYEHFLQNATTDSFTLKRVHALLAALGNPQSDIKCIHVAGTKGKGSTCVLAASILAACGYKTGLYTSPHFYDIEERIRILSSARTDKNKVFPGKITKEQFAQCMARVKRASESLSSEKDFAGLTYFEALTAAAFLYFQEERVDFTVLETGLGGRLDATNIARALVCALTPIDLEHTAILGNTLAGIAKEKAGIVKERKQKVICAPQPKEAMDVVRTRIADIGTECKIIGEDIIIENIERSSHKQILSVKTPDEQYGRLETKMIAGYEAVNIATAVGMVEFLKQMGYSVDKQAVVQGVAQAFWPGRFEIVQENPLVLGDGAHTPSSTKMLINDVQEIFKGKNIRLVLGISKDKDIKQVCAQWDEVADKVILTKSRHPRAYCFTKDDAARYFKRAKITLSEDVNQAMDLALKGTDKDIVVMSGSLFVVAEARKICRPSI